MEPSKSIYALLDLDIIESGMIGSMLMKVTPRSHISAPWLDITRPFMDKLKMPISLPHLQTLHLLRQRDQGIMEMAGKYTTNKLRITAIINCRLYLQVHNS
jgi:hypothetical protein